MENQKRKNVGKSLKMPYTEAKIFEEFSHNFKQELDTYTYTFLKRVTIMWLETRKKAFIVTGPDKQSTYWPAPRTEYPCYTNSVPIHNPLLFYSFTLCLDSRSNVLLKQD